MAHRSNELSPLTLRQKIFHCKSRTRGKFAIWLHKQIAKAHKYPADLQINHDLHR